jgi:two-component system sensor histidine kinase HydH
MPILRVAGPTVLVSVILFSACTATAIFLYRLHAQTAEILTDNIDSRRIAGEMESTLRGLIKSVANGDAVDSQNERLRELLAEAGELVNSDKERELVNQLGDSIDRYDAAWEARNRKEAVRILEKDALPGASRLRAYNNEQILVSEDALRRTIKWIAWGLGLVGIVGSLAGVFLGYSVARGLRQSMYRLSVRIRDAADKLREELPTVTFSKGGSIDALHEQMRALVQNIEEVVERLQQRDRELLRAEQMAAVGQLAAGVAHELRNPLTAVKMLVQTSRADLERRGMPADDLAVIEQEIRRLERSLQTFLDFARPPRMERRAVDLAPIIGEALTLVGGRARQQNVAIDFVPPFDPVPLEADGEQLRQLLLNLAMNALDAMPDGGTLTVAVEASADSVAVHISDTGPGIAAQVLPRLFEPFVSGKETGVGLGLVISRRIAESHGGTLTAVSQPQGGVRFTLTLPWTPPLPPPPNARLAPDVQLARH